MDIGLLRTETIDVSREEIFFGLGTNPPIFSGLNKLVQIFTITLLTEAGTDAMDLDHGAGLLEVLGRPINRYDTTDVEVEINVIFAEAQRQVLADQETVEIPESERLREAIVRSVVYDLDRQELQIEFTIENVRGERAFVRL